MVPHAERDEGRGESPARIAALKVGRDAPEGIQRCLGLRSAGFVLRRLLGLLVNLETYAQ